MVDEKILKARIRMQERQEKRIAERTKIMRPKRLAHARTLLAEKRVSVREKFFLGRWRICFYVYDAGSPTGVTLWCQFEQDDPEILTLLQEFNVKLRPGNVLFG